MKDARARDDIAQRLSALCFEMEAAGIIDSLQCLPIRSIRDYSDSHTNKEWQDYAAATPAAYARELVEGIPPSPRTLDRTPHTSPMRPSPIPQVIQTIALPLPSPL